MKSSEHILVSSVIRLRSLLKVGAVFSLTLLVGCKTKPKIPYGDDMERAIDQGSLATVKVLLDAGVDPNSSNRYRMTPLCDAASSDHPEIVQALLDGGANPNLFSPEPVECSPLLIAAGHGPKAVVEVLVKNGADPNLHPKGDLTPLINAMQSRHDDIAIYLISHGANPNYSPLNLRSPLSYALADGPEDQKPSLAEVMLAHRATLRPAECIGAVRNINRNNYESAVLGDVVRLKACQNADLSSESE